MFIWRHVTDDKPLDEYNCMFKLMLSLVIVYHIAVECMNSMKNDISIMIVIGSSYLKSISVPYGSSYL